MLNKRKALIGWLVYTVGKPIAKRTLRSKAKGAVPGRKEGTRRPNLAAILTGVGALVGGLAFWRKRKGGSETPES